MADTDNRDYRHQVFQDYDFNEVNNIKGANDVQSNTSTVNSQVKVGTIPTTDSENIDYSVITEKSIKSNEDIEAIKSVKSKDIEVSNTATIKGELLINKTPESEQTPVEVVKVNNAQLVIKSDGSLKSSSIIEANDIKFTESFTGKTVKIYWDEKTKSLVFSNITENYSFQ